MRLLFILMRKIQDYLTKVAMSSAAVAMTVKPNVIDW